MLVFGRLPGEAFLIGHEITVKIIEVCGNKVRIGIEAPKEVPVHREEVYLTLYPKEDRSDATVV